MVANLGIEEAAQARARGGRAAPTPARRRPPRPRARRDPAASRRRRRPRRRRHADERRGAEAQEAAQPQAREAALMGLLVWIMVAIALWHFTIFLPDRWWAGIVGAFLGAVVGSVIFGLIINLGTDPRPGRHRPADGVRVDPGRGAGHGRRLVRWACARSASSTTRTRDGAAVPRRDPDAVRRRRLGRPRRLRRARRLAGRARASTASSWPAPPARACCSRTTRSPR